MEESRCCKLWLGPGWRQKQRGATGTAGCSTPAPGLSSLVMRAWLREQLPRARLGRGAGSCILLPHLSLLGGGRSSEHRVCGSEPGVGPGQVRLSAGFGHPGGQRFPHGHLSLPSAAATDMFPHPPAQTPDPGQSPRQGAPHFQARGSADLSPRPGATQTQSPLSGIS